MSARPYYFSLVSRETAELLAPIRPVNRRDGPALIADVLAIAFEEGSPLGIAGDDALDWHTVVVTGGVDATEAPRTRSRDTRTRTTRR